MPLSRIMICTAALVGGVLALGSHAAADDGFFRSSPGALSASHAAMDRQRACTACHLGGKATSDAKCLGCHDHADLKRRIDARTGFHASRRVRGRRCTTCHLEHRGRGFDVRGWPSVPGGQRGFDHGLTGWSLRKRHARIACARCHERTNRQGLRVFLGERALCGACHASDSPHGSTRDAMRACDRCHTQVAWKPPRAVMRFDHNRASDAAMPLAGAHADVACVKCHRKARFVLGRDDPGDCADCHESPHRRHLFGTRRCADCHSPSYSSMAKVRFDHARRAHFDIRGAHSRLDCYDCHDRRRGRHKPTRRCASRACHAKDDLHGARFAAFGGTPSRCGVCHRSASWKATAFDHGGRTRFALGGKHAKLACRRCHRGVTDRTRRRFEFERLDARTVGCRGCHQHKDAHGGKFADDRCLTCHEAPGVKTITRAAVSTYHGDDSKFPLTGKHARVVCRVCHREASYEHVSPQCGDRCHQDSLHRGTLGRACLRCHRGAVWKAVAFDHDEDTSWPLVGWHRKVVACADCHPDRAGYHGTPRTCGARGCHAEDDAHGGALGRRCERCHRETGDNVFDHNRQARFALDGVHARTRCSACHASVRFKPRPTACAGCHRAPVGHRGRFGAGCGRCHTTRSFADIIPLHEAGSFSLGGAHDSVPCGRCHVEGRSLQGTGDLCVSCHRDDDVHAGSLSPRCGDCHTQWSFAPARFEHVTVGCNLPGIHRVLPCFDCHQAGGFGGLNPTCYGCHKSDAVRIAGARDPLGAGGHRGQVACGPCHNPNAWRPAQGSHGYFKESICR